MITQKAGTSTGFINTYILKTALDAGDSTLIAMQNAIADVQGARGSGKIITFSGLSPDEVSSTLLEEIGSGGAGSKAIIEASELTYNLDKNVITGAYLIPPALSGIDNSSGFSGEDLTEAYFVFNAITQGGRDTIESEINRVLKDSVFRTKKIKIKKLSLDVDDEEEVEGETIEGETPEEAKANAVFSKMSGREMQNLQRVVRKFNKEEISRAQAEQMLIGFGLTIEQVSVWLD